MSLWTPDGEHPVDQGRSQEPAPVGDDHGSNYDDLDPEAAARVQEQLAQAQAQLLAAPVDQVVSNHVMGLFELAALHLRVEDPDLEAARLPGDFPVALRARPNFRSPPLLGVTRQRYYVVGRA